MTRSATALRGTTVHEDYYEHLRLHEAGWEFLALKVFRQCIFKRLLLRDTWDWINNHTIKIASLDSQLLRPTPNTSLPKIYSLLPRSTCRRLCLGVVYLYLYPYMRPEAKTQTPRAAPSKPTPSHQPIHPHD